MGIKNFLKDEKGNVALMFAGSMMAICGVVGASVDYARLINEKQTAQNVLDASLLAAATEFQKTGNKRKAETVGIKHMTSSMPNIKKKNLKITVKNQMIDGTYDDEIDNTFLAIFIAPTTPWAINSSIKYSSRRTTDFSLAVDVSNSMITSNLMTGLRRSLASFSTKAFENTQPGDVSVSIVPFANGVSFEQKYERWLDPVNGKSQTTTFNGCFENEPIGTKSILDTTGNSNRIAAFDRRRAPNNENVPFCPEDNSNVAFYIDNEVDLSSKVSNLTTGQGTNTAEGLAWAWRTLSPEWRNVFNESATYPRPLATTNNKVLILLTDGRPIALPSVNVQTDRDKAREDALDNFREACDQIIAAGNIDLYTIVYGDVMSKNQRATIRKCTAGNGRSFWGGNADQLASIFTKIVAMNSELALSR